MQETLPQSLVQEDPLEKEMATHSSILAWEIPWTEEPGGLQSMGSQKSHDLGTKQQQPLLPRNKSLSLIEGNESGPPKRLYILYGIFTIFFF